MGRSSRDVKLVLTTVTGLEMTPNSPTTSLKFAWLNRRELLGDHSLAAELLWNRMDLATGSVSAICIITVETGTNSDLIA